MFDELTNAIQTRFADGHERMLVLMSEKTIVNLYSSFLSPALIEQFDLNNSRFLGQKIIVNDKLQINTFKIIITK